MRIAADLPAPLRCIPGNHDVGFYGEDDERDRRLARFRAAWGGDRFIADLAAWRIVGADAYLLGSAEHDDWLRSVTRTEAPVIVFIHQPLTGDAADGWEMPAAARQAFDAAVDGADVRVIASGHRHVCAQLGRAVWAPSLTLTGEAGPDRDPRPGFVEHLLAPEHTWRVLRPWESGR